MDTKPLFYQEKSQAEGTGRPAAGHGRHGFRLSCTPAPSGHLPCLLQSELTGERLLEPTKDKKFSPTSGDIVNKLNHQTHSLLRATCRSLFARRGGN